MPGVKQSMSSIIETIKARVDVVEEIGLVVSLQKSGKAFKGACPFHNERTPSFYVFGETQHWYCFGCHESGDIFTFVQKQQGLEFHDALLYLAEKAGVQVEDEPGLGRSLEEMRESGAHKERRRKLNEEAQLWFHQVLLRSKGAAESRAYVQSRGISTDSVLTFGLGYAPDNWDALSSYLLAQGYSEHELVEASLANAREADKGGGVYDYFRNRLIFPIRDLRGRVIGFGGRALGEDKPKYLNSRQTLLFEKNSVLYALNHAKDAIKLANQVIIVEGYVDAIIAHQYGTRQVVACIGSAITEKHIQQIKKLTRQVTLALDPDAAGIAATEHGIQEAQKSFDRTVVPVPLAAPAKGRKRGGPQGIIRLEEQIDAEINVLRLPPGEDPDEVIRRDFAQWAYAVAHPLPLVDYYFVAKTVGLDMRQPHGKSEAAKRLLPVIGMISDRVKRDAYIRKLAGMISIDERSLHSELQRVLRGQHSTAVTAEFVVSTSARSGKGGPQGRDARNSRGKPGPDGDMEDELGDSAGASDRVGGGGGGKISGLDRALDDRVQWEDYLIGLLVQNPGLSSYVCGIINDGDFIGTDTRELYHILNSVYQQRGSSSSHQPIEQHMPSALLETLARAQKSAGVGASLDGAGLIKAAVQCATRLKRMRLIQLNTELRYLLHEAEESGDSAAVRQFGQHLSAIYQQIRTIDSATHLQG